MLFCQLEGYITSLVAQEIQPHFGLLSLGFQGQMEYLMQAIYVFRLCTLLTMLFF